MVTDCEGQASQSPLGQDMVWEMRAGKGMDEESQAFCYGRTFRINCKQDTLCLRWDLESTLIKSRQVR